LFPLGIVSAGPAQTELRGEPHELQQQERQPEEQQRRVDHGRDGHDGDLGQEQRAGDEQVPDRQAR
jgi:hypothetical protein